ncbi:MAG TPA: hypothetical protein VLF62_04480 [Candidatus Saccharimonadales bacterium]|nr:hypothetical protein [Candidatus Saccharimonadales bacterium]
MTDTPNKFPAPTAPEFDQALAILHPADHAGLVTLSENPDMQFSLVRPLIEPAPDSLQDMQDDIAGVLQGHARFLYWHSAGVMETKYMGATYFDGEPYAQSSPALFQGVSSFGLAIELCNMLPQTAANPTAGVIDKVCITTPRRERCSIWLALACDAAVAEYQSIHPAVESNATTPPSRAVARLGYIRKEGMDSYIPAASIRERVERSVPPSTPVQLDRVRLFLHPKGTSPYRKLK